MSKQTSPENREKLSQLSTEELVEMILTQQKAIAAVHACQTAGIQMNVLFETVALNLNQGLICLLPMLSMIPMVVVANFIDPQK